MDSTEAHHGEVNRSQGDMTESARTLLSRLRDSAVL
jgi:hypothetical protein